MVTGTGGLGGWNDIGVNVVGGSSITSTNANDLTVNGTGGQSETGLGNVGINLGGSWSRCRAR